MARVGAFDPDDDVTVPCQLLAEGVVLDGEVIDLDLDIDNTTFLAAAVFTAGGMCRSIVETSPPRPRHAGMGNDYGDEGQLSERGSVSAPSRDLELRKCKMRR